MKVFVWNCIEEASGNYHSGGGVVVFAETEERARILATEVESDCKIRAEEMPIDVREVVGGIEAAYVMPDAGCC